jgi:hypothetical protein
MTMNLAIFILVWYVIGVVSFIFHWTYDEDLEVWSLLLAIGVGFMGLLAFPYGYWVHPRKSEHKIGKPENIFKKRRIE